MTSKQLHARCSVAKLLCLRGGGAHRRPRSCRFLAAAATCARTAPNGSARELRVDRIWEGASEVQKLIIARALGKRGLDGI